MAAKGLYICIEGIDGSGKSTLTQVLADHLWAKAFQFPSDNLIGGLIRMGLRGETDLDKRTYLYLFAADGLQQDRAIRYYLDAGTSVVCDRHPTLSGKVYQPDHHDPGVVKQVGDCADLDGLLAPDLLFFLDVPPEVSLQRMQERNKYKDVVFETDQVDKMSTLRKRYLKVAEQARGIVLNGTLPLGRLRDIMVSHIEDVRACKQP